MKVNEIFLSLAGEGPDTGIPMIFVRLQGCNLVPGCLWCDTAYALGEDGEDIDVDEIVRRVIENVDTYHCNRVYLTGGEPLIRDIKPLVRLLIHAGYWVTVATNGTLPRPPRWKRVLWDIDCKCPSSGVSMFDWSWSTVGQKNRLKFVVADQTDLNFVVDILPKLKGPLCPTLVVSPMNPIGTDNMNRPWLQEVWDFCIKYNLRYSLQVHKVVFGNKKGV